MKKIKKEKVYSYKDISVEELENEITREKYKYSFSHLLKSTLYILIIIIAVSTLIATFFMPVIEISESTMKPLINNGEIVITIKNTKLKQGDIIAFYHGNKILVKRVIGVAGDFVNIDIEGKVYVNGNLLQENYVSELKLGDDTVTFPLQVPDKSIFVLSDERNSLTDSRLQEIGCIKEEDLIGRVIFKIWPINKIKKI